MTRIEMIDRISIAEEKLDKITRELKNIFTLIDPVKKQMIKHVNEKGY